MISFEMGICWYVSKQANNQANKGQTSEGETGIYFSLQQGFVI